MSTSANRASRWTTANAGRVAFVLVVAAYFAVFWAVGGVDSWDRLGVRPAPFSFLDMRSVTSGWECTDRGIDVLPSNPCDPVFARPMNYPRLWLVPSFTGIGQEATVALGVTAAIGFFCAVLYLVGRAGAWDGVVVGLGFVSPAAMLAIERGNIDTVVFTLLLVGVALLRGDSAARVASYGLLLLTAMLKLFPVFAWGVLLRQPRRRLAWSLGLLTLAFAVYVAVTADTIQTIQDVVPQGVAGFYGAEVGFESLQTWAADELSADWATDLGDWPAVTALLAALVAMVLLARRWDGREDEGPRDHGSRFRLDAFVAGAGIYAGTFASLVDSYDYRLIFLLLALPQLLAWSRAQRSPVPFPRLTLVLILAAMWLGEPMSAEVGFWTDPIGALTYPQLGLAVEEICNWLVFLSLGTGLARVLLGALRAARDDRWPAAPA